MGTIDDYLATLDPADAGIIAHAYEIALDLVPEAIQGTSYGMPALMYRDKGLLSVMRAKKHFGLYPYSGRTISTCEAALEGIDHAKGTVRFQGEAPLSDDILTALVLTRKAEIDG